MIRKAARMMFMAVVVLAVAILAVMVLGLERVWSLFGQPDLGPVTFETLQRRITPNDALACPEDLCRAHSDVTPPVMPSARTGCGRPWPKCSPPSLT